MSDQEGRGIVRLIKERFECGDPLLRGRFSTLYPAIERSTGKPVVMRHLQTLLFRKKSRDQILLEGKLLSQLRHPNLPTVMEVLEDDSELYLVLEPFSGQTLEEFVKAKPREASVLRRLIHQLILVVSYLHSQDPPIVHRDIHPGSILVTADGTIKIVEFGLAKLFEDSAERSQTVFRGFGSALFAAPEQLWGEASNPKSDVYSIGATAYFIATGQSPPAPFDLALGKLSLPPIRQLHPDVAEEMEQCIVAMMNIDVQLRSSLAEVLEAVRWSDEDYAVPAIAEEDDSATLCVSRAPAKDLVVVSPIAQPVAACPVVESNLKRIDPLLGRPKSAVAGRLPRPVNAVPLATKADSEKSPQGNFCVSGRYEILAPMLECRFSTLYYARDRATMRPIVLRKLENPGAASQSPQHREARLQIMREGRLLTSLSHRNLPRVVEIVEDADDIYVVLEDFSGKSLQESIQNSAADLPGPELLQRYLEQFLSVLKYLHGQKPAIVQRDLRPQTLILTPHGVLKLAEFSLARMWEDSREQGRTSFRAQGCPFYAAPEQLLGEPSRPANDLYSVGAMLYFMATARRPPKSVERLMGKDSLTPLREIREDLPEALVQVIQWLLSPSAEQRPESAEQVTERLTSAKSGNLVSPPAAIVEVELEDPSKAHAPGALGSARKAAQAFARKLSSWQLIFGKKKEPETDSAADEMSELSAAIPPFVNLSEIVLHREQARILNETVARSIAGICIGRSDGAELWVAVKDPAAGDIQGAVSIGTKGLYSANVVVAAPELIDHAIDYVYRSDHLARDYPWKEFLQGRSAPKEAPPALPATHELPAVPVAVAISSAQQPHHRPVEPLDCLITEATTAGASDIHLETTEHGLNVRFRIDGTLRVVEHLPSNQATALVRRIKEMASMDLRHDAIPRGGRFSMVADDRALDVQVSLLPVSSGENIALRLFDKSSSPLTLGELGVEPEIESRLRRILLRPAGMVLISGPSRAGKSTTLYAILREIDGPGRKLLAVEERLSYTMPGVTQVRLNTAPAAGEAKVTLAQVSREFLRHDADAMLVGEIRDAEMAGLAAQSALGGQLFLAAIQAQDSMGIIARLLELGCDPLVVGSTLVCGLAQRLARRICRHCKEEIEVTESARELFHAAGLRQPRQFRGNGCQECHHKGFRGRVVVMEMLEVTPEIRALVERSASHAEIRKLASARGQRSLAEAALSMVVQGHLTLEEVQRIRML